MKNYSVAPTRLSIKLLKFILLLCSPVPAFAQPMNDHCESSLSIPFSEDENNIITIEGDTRKATASDPPPTCSGSWYTDDVWFNFTTPSVLPLTEIVVKAYFNNALTPTDVRAIGMAVYDACGQATEIGCFSSDLPEDHSIFISTSCLLTDHQYYIRIWSTGADSTTEGTFRLGVFAHTSSPEILWSETFGGGLEANGWSTEGSCAIADSNQNAGWKFLPDGLLDKGAYIFQGAGIASPSICDGAVGVDSDYDDNFGIQDNFGGGPCPAPAQHILISPEINTSTWNTVGLSLSWVQAIRQYQSNYFISYRTKEEGADWSDWVDFQVNTEFESGGDFYNNNKQQHYLTGAAGHDYLQIRFVYNANYYVWGIDDVKLLSTGNGPSGLTNNYAIAPWAMIPSQHTFPFGAMVDVQNSNSFPIDSVYVTCTVTNEDNNEIVYSSELWYGTLPADTIISGKLNPELVTIPGGDGNYRADYNLYPEGFADAGRASHSFRFSTGHHYFALEDGFTRSVAVAEGVYYPGVPLSYAFGNFFRPVLDQYVDHIQWGANNAGEMAGQTVQIYLIEWTDLNKNKIAESSERIFVAYDDYTFTGDEGQNVLIDSYLENFSIPGALIQLKANKGYIAIVEYQAETADDPQFFMLASEARDYSGQIAASDTMVAWGLAEEPFFGPVLGFSVTGNLNNIDYELRELDPNDNRLFFGHDIVPVVRLHVIYPDGLFELDPANLISVFPNPAVEQFQVKLEFTQPYSDVKLRLVDNSGRVVQARQINQTINNHIETVNVKNLSSGNYMLQVETVDGQRSLPVVIIK